MIYISIPSSQKDDANAFVKMISPGDTEDTFVENKTDGSDNYCLVALPDNKSDFVEQMKNQFEFTNVDPRNADAIDAYNAILGTQMGRNQMQQEGMQATTLSVLEDIDSGDGGFIQGIKNLFN